MSETFALRIDSIAAGGDGVGRREGIVVFVPRAAPGDLARVKADRQDRLMRGRILSVLEPSALRADPCCDHYVIDRCGGCQMQHLTYDAQLGAKSVIIRDAIKRIGRVDISAPVVDASEKQWRYRRKLTLKLRRIDDRLIAGLHRYDAPDEIFDLKDCPITDERVVAAWSFILDHAALLPMSRELRAAVRLLDAGFSFTVEGGTAWMSHGELFGAGDDMRELWWQPDAQALSLLHSRSAEVQAGASFTQVNPGVASALREHVLKLAAIHEPKTVVDGYAGTGDLAAALAKLGARVVAIEIDRNAARLASTRLPSNSRVIADAVERALPDALPADLVVLNPPRAGLDPRVPETLRATIPRPPLIYVSCNPATLARDIRRMEGYVIRSIRGFDMFPQTAHVETVCELVHQP